jgi:hypothetical protein
MKQAIAYKEHPNSRKKLGHCHIEAGLIGKKDLPNALEFQKVQKEKIGQIFIEMGMTNDEQICQALCTENSAAYFIGYRLLINYASILPTGV